MDIIKQGAAIHVQRCLGIYAEEQPIVLFMILWTIQYLHVIMILIAKFHGRGTLGGPHSR